VFVAAAGAWLLPNVNGDTEVTGAVEGAALPNTGFAVVVVAEPNENADGDAVVVAVDPPNEND
jgi:hypothetical protein